MIATSETTLRDHHRHELRASGLSDEMIEAAGLYSEDRPAVVAAMLGRTYSKARGSALVFPFCEPSGETSGFRRVKPTIPRKDREGKSVKYESPSGVANRAYFPPGIAGSLTDPIQLLITEGEKKSLAAQQEGFACLGLIGVWGWKPGQGSDRLIADLEVIGWRGRPVFIVFDSDASNNENIRLAESRLAAQLRSRGAVVKVVRLPGGPDGAKMGLDDFLLAHGRDELYRLIAAAHEPEEADPERISANVIDVMPEARRFLERHAMHEGGLTLRFWRSEFHIWRDGRFVVFSETDLKAQLIQYLDSFANRLNRQIIGNVVECIRSETFVGSHERQPCWLGVDPPFPAGEMLATKNGLLHVSSMLRGEFCLLPATPHYFSANAVTFDFDPAATCPAWDEFLATLWPDDRESIDTLSEWFGYLLMRGTEQHKLLMLLGPTRSGKGVIGRTLKALIGDGNVASPTLASLAGPFGIQPLLNKTVALVSDARLSGRVDGTAIVEEILSITGEDARDVHRKHLPTIPAVRLPVRFVVLTNELPNMRDPSGSLLGRVVLLAMTQSWLGREDRTIDARVQQELPGILNWSIRGWERLQSRGHFVQPASGADLLADLADISSPIGGFVRDRCDVGPNYCVSADDLFAAWRTWCESAGRDRPGTIQAFGRDLRAATPMLRVSRLRIGGDRVRQYDGIRIK